MTARIKLMIVEDEAMTALYIKMMLEKKGYDVSIFPSGEKAVEAVGRVAPDLIIMDIHLAGKIDGIEAARRIRDAVNVPIIFATGYQENLYLETTESLEPLAFVTKPIDINKITSIIAGYFKEKTD